MKPLVTVVWDDATSYDKAWFPKKINKRCELTRVVSTGYLVKEDDQGVTIAQSYDDEGAYWTMLVIPWGMIVEWYDT